MKIRALATALLLTVMVVASVMSAARQEPPLAPMPPGPPSALTPAEIQIYRWAPTLIQWTPKEIEECPVLHTLQPAANQHQLPMILERAGQTAMQSFADFPQTACEEGLTSEMTSGGRPETKHQKFRYIVTPRAAMDNRAFFDE